MIKIGDAENPNETVMLLIALILPRFLLNQIIIIFLEVIVKTPCPLNLIKKNKTVIIANGTNQESLFKNDLKVSLIFTEIENNNNEIPKKIVAKNATYLAP